MKLPRPSSRETPPHSRPPRAAEFLQDEARLDEEVEFDPHRDMRERDLLGMERLLKEWIRNDWREQLSQFESFLALFFLLPQDRRDRLGLDGITLEERWSQVALDQAGRDWGEAVKNIASLALLFPERREELRKNVATKWDAYIQDLNTFRLRDWLTFSQIALSLVFLFPERREMIGLDGTCLEWLKKELEEDRGRNWSSFSFKAKFFALLFPDSRDEIDLDQEAWKGMESVFKGDRQSEDWWHFADMAFNLTILASDDARITSDGQILITPKKPRLSKAPKPLPKRSRV